MVATRVGLTPGLDAPPRELSRLLTLPVPGAHAWPRGQVAASESPLMAAAITTDQVRLPQVRG